MKLSKMLFVVALILPALSLAETLTGNARLPVDIGMANTDTRVRVHIDHPGNTTLSVGNTGVMAAVASGSKISAYDRAPMIYNYYVLEMKPARVGERNLILRETDGSTRSFCPENSNALLKAYKGDGTFVAACVAFE